MPGPRQVLFRIPNGAGFTHANIKRLSQIAAELRDIRILGLNATDVDRERKAIIQRIMRNGAYNSPVALEQALLPIIRKYRRLNAALRHNREIANNWQEGRWRKVQEAGGKFKALGRVAAMRPRSPNANASRRYMGSDNAGTIANVMRPYMLATATPLTTTYNRYLMGPPKQRKRKSPSPVRSPPKSVTTRSGRRSVKPRN